MATDLQTDTEANVATLVSGIVNDALDLMKQQAALLKHELSSELVKFKETALTMGAGMGFAIFGVLFLALMLVFLFQWAGLFLWAAFGIVGLLLLGVGAALAYWGKTKAETIDPLPRQTVQGIKENVRWITKPK
jgi:uncharacterized membrane protein YqjE